MQPGEAGTSSGSQCSAKVGACLDRAAGRVVARKEISEAEFKQVWWGGAQGSAQILSAFLEDGGTPTYSYLTYLGGYSHGYSELLNFLLSP